MAYIILKNIIFIFTVSCFKNEWFVLLGILLYIPKHNLLNFLYHHMKNVLVVCKGKNRPTINLTLSWKKRLLLPK